MLITLRPKQNVSKLATKPMDCSEDEIGQHLDF